MPNAKLTAPPSPAAARAARARALQAKSSRTPAELSELLGILTARVDELEARLESRP